MTTDNLEFWNKVKQPPPTALKAIKGGRLKGKSDINPQWRYQVMTEHFGPCGVGWKYKVTRQWIEDGSADQKCAFVNIDMFIKDGDEWSDPIPGSGGSMLVEKESAGLHTSDEAFKMATTDALSVAMKLLGVAGDVYAGFWDGSKYQKDPGSGSIDSGKMSDADAKKEVGRLRNTLTKCDTDQKCSKWWKDNSKAITKLPKNLQDQITKGFTEYRGKFFKQCVKGNPDKPETVKIEKCSGCDTREGCPAWQEEDNK